MSEHSAKQRPLWDVYFARIARDIATRGTCARRKVGCVLIDRDHRILATGYNGPASGLPHCIDEPCKGADAPSGTALDLCEAIHAEQNALLQCSDARRIYACYTTTAPCVTCTKLLLNTACSRIVFENSYPHAEESQRLWLQRPSFYSSAKLPDEARGWYHVAVPPNDQELLAYGVEKTVGADEIKGFYRHYKTPDAVSVSDLYQAFGVIEDGDTHLSCVVYAAPVSKYPFKLCVRPLSQWQELVTIDYENSGRAKRVPRFVRVEPKGQLYE